MLIRIRISLRFIFTLFCSNVSITVATCLNIKFRGFVSVPILQELVLTGRQVHVALLSIPSQFFRGEES